MSTSTASKHIVRKSFGKIKDIVPVPDLIEIQSRSFNDFVQLDCLPSERKLIGLEKVFRDIFPIHYGEKMSLEFLHYELGVWSCTCGKLSGLANRYTWNCTSCKKSDCSRLNDNLECTFCNKNTARYTTCSNCLARVTIQLPMSLEECRSSGQSFTMPLKVQVQLVTWDVDDKGKKEIREIKEQNLFFVDLPVMADLYEEDGCFKLGSLGTFLINGVDRVVVSQLHRSPGAVFTLSKKVKDVRGRPYYLARVIPMRGSWLDFEFDSNDFLYVRIDKKKKMLVTTFLQALGVKREEIIPLFYRSDLIHGQNGDFYRAIDESLIGLRIEKGMLPESIESSFLGQRITKDTLQNLNKAGVDRLSLKKAHLINRIFSKDVVDDQTGELLVEQGQSFTQELYDLFAGQKSIQFNLITSSGFNMQPIIANTLTQDRCYSENEALKELHSKVWPGDSSSLQEIKDRLANMLFSSRLYDLTRVGRIRMNRKLGLNVSEDIHSLTKEDVFATLRYLVNLRELGEGELDDIDHLGNRRVRLVGELLTNQIYQGFLRIERIVQERFRIQEAQIGTMPHDLLNVKPLSASLREFFGTGPLSQFMDQTNPLAEIAHKRRLSALGPGGVMKDRATFEIRDVHTSHYGRICPIETPEGQTVGLISSLATYAMVNDLGFIETAYRPVSKGDVKDEVSFLDAFAEEKHFIAQAGPEGRSSSKEDKIFARHEGNFMYADSDAVDYVDLSPKQLVSVSTALIPFLEHDDASRALMGSNMQRQAVPLIKAQAPLVGTGMEHEIAKSSGAVLTAKRGGVVQYVSSEKIIICADQSAFRSVEDWVAQGIDVYHLKKFQRSSYCTWIHHAPIVKRGDKVNAGDILTNGTSMDRGELALGNNLLVAFMPWHGYNFEDAIVLNKRLVADDLLASVFIDEYIADARETKLGPEEITRDIPNVSEEALSCLDDEGIVRIGTRVKSGDILVGKITLKGEIQYSPEEKLLRAIFGEKAREVRDTSMRVPPGVEGTVMDVKVFSRSGIRKDKRYKDMVLQQTAKLEEEYALLKDKLHDMVQEKVATLLIDADIANESARSMSLSELFTIKVKDTKVVQQLETFRTSYENQLRILENIKLERINKLKKGDPLPSGVIKMVKVYIATKRPVSVGDKIAGRHGNKGVVSNIVPREDMPYLDDGTPVDVVLNPLGVPSRMNVGQILETILGFIGREQSKDVAQAIAQKSYAHIKESLTKTYGKDFVDSYEKSFGQEEVQELARRTAQQGVAFSTPVFDGANFDHDIKPMLKDLNLSETGAYKIRDGRTGEYFDQDVTVGCIYMMKLNHMVEDKLHARSVGPYSLVTQQPLGGKAQMGGQRFGEMEVWALEAYGAAYALQEMLTYKSDDVNGRHKVYEAIVRGDEVPEPGLPESFNVLVKELQSLGLQVDLFKSGKEDVNE